MHFFCRKNDEFPEYDQKAIIAEREIKWDKFFDVSNNKINCFWFHDHLLFAINLNEISYRNFQHQRLWKKKI